MCAYSIPPSILRYIFNKHKDLIRELDVADLKTLEEKLKSFIEHADEIYADAFEVKYYVKKINKFYVNVVICKDVVKTAYLLSSKTYDKMRRRRWVQMLY